MLGTTKSVSLTDTPSDFLMLRVVISIAWPDSVEGLKKAQRSPHGCKTVSVLILSTVWTV